MLPRSALSIKLLGLNERMQALSHASVDRYSSGVFTDGGCSPNPGPGGWGYVVAEDDRVIAEDFGGDPGTTNNRMELTAIIHALAYCRDLAVARDENPPAPITIYADSKLCVQTYNEWMAGWEKRGWKRSRGAIQNLDLVKQLAALKVECPFVRLEWVAAHTGIRWNEYADSLVHRGRAQFGQS
ncbi:MAG: ribonuclease H [Cyanobacteria bacterium P01_D01_bin.123]